VGGYREVRCVFNQSLNLTNVFNSLTRGQLIPNEAMPTEISTAGRNT